MPTQTLDALHVEARTAAVYYEALTTMAYSKAAGEPSHVQRATQPLPINVDALDHRRQLEELLITVGTRYPQSVLMFWAGTRPPAIVTDTIAAELHEWNLRARDILEPPRQIPIPTPCTCGASQTYSMDNQAFTCDNGCKTLPQENPWIRSYQPTSQQSSSNAVSAESNA